MIKKYILFVGLGFVGGFGGDFLREPFLLLLRIIGQCIPSLASIGEGGSFLWTASLIVTAAAITLALRWAESIYRRRGWMGVAAAVKVAVLGAVAGLVANILTQFFYSHFDFNDWLVRPVAWGLLGAMLAAALSMLIPNFGFRRGLIAGFLGGALGGVSFLMLSHSLPDLFGRLAGYGILGAALGLAIVIADQLFRSATLEIIWAPGETSSTSLGAEPVYVGGGDDDYIYVLEMPRHAGQFVQKDGTIQYVDNQNGTAIVLEDGSQVSCGDVQVVVHVKSPGQVSASNVTPVATLSAPASSPVATIQASPADTATKPTITTTKEADQGQNAPPKSSGGVDWLK